MKRLTPERLLRHREKMHRKWEAAYRANPIAMAGSCSPRIYDEYYLWAQSQMLRQMKTEYPQ